MVSKKMQLLSCRNSKPKMGDNGSKFKEDMISGLPDEILGTILSLLTFREATRTCVISNRWERLFTLFSGSLVFDFTADPFTGRAEHREHERSKYIDWVNQVLTSIDGDINEFIVRCHSDELLKCHIDRWVAFAFKKRVQRLELHMKPLDCDRTQDYRPYAFPVEFCSHIMEPSGLYTISCLKSLCLKYVQITEELVKYFLTNCPLLELLCVSGSEQLTTLKVIGGATLRLKFLEISLCFKLECLEISAPNLVSFKYFGPRINLQVENNPKLLEVSIGRVDVINLVLSLSSYFTRIETLTLNIDTKVHEEFSQSLKLNRVKHLTMGVHTYAAESLLGWTSLIRCCPLLHKLTLEITTFSPCRRKLQKVIGHPHESLKVVELIGLVGYATDMEFAMYLLASSTALEKIIVNCCEPNISWRVETDKTYIVEQAKSRRRVRKLKKNYLPA